MKQPIFIAHRGAWNPKKKENSQEAIERAANSGNFAYIELDVRRTRSDDNAYQTPILLHDETLDRVYDEYKVPKSKRNREGQAVYGLTLEVIRNEPIQITTLADGIRAAKGHPLNLEIKSDKTIDPVIEVLTDLINKYDDWSWEKIVISSFDWNILYEFKQKTPQIGIAMLYGFKNLGQSFGRPYHSLDARWIKFNKWLIPICAPLALSFGIKNIHTYTVNSTLGVKLLKLFKVVGFTTDNLTLPETFINK